jgi:uncharacterized protein YcbK (DUF882 family)
MHNKISSPTRREFASLLIGGAVALSVPRIAVANTLPAVRSIALRSIHTGESGSFTFMEGGQYQHETIAAMNHLLRDHRTGEVADMDMKLIDQLFQLQQRYGANKHFEVISGYRSFKSNSMLAAKSNGVAKKSLHMQGKAIDIAMPGVDIGDLHRSAKSLKAGGVGLYTGSGFIHIDTGHVRYW